MPAGFRTAAFPEGTVLVLTRIVLVLVGSEFLKFLGSEISEIFWKFIAKPKIIVKLSNKF